ncbi:MAG: glycosyltransferase family 4 protein [Marinobacter sp.]|uniref:glycosyltransferase family 4 protein n=1 Tax=Marinobacter sp. TaxID=50741 RepID=UPI00329A303D
MIHLSNNFVSSSVHLNLIKSISGIDGAQYVVVPVRNRKLMVNNSSVGSAVHIKFCLFRNRVIRFFPLAKIFYVFLKCFFALKDARDAVLKIGKEPALLCHNFWSDGMVGFLFSFFYPLKYVLVVRNTDINYFVAKLPHYRWLMRLMVRRSSGVVFVSQAHRNRFESNWPSVLKASRRVKVIPNAITNWWLENLITEPIQRPFQACFVGRFNKNKNLTKLGEAAKIIHGAIPEFRLVLVGGSESEFLQVTGFDAVPSFVEVRGLCEAQKVRDVYRSSRVFAMPSLTETFGLVYVEALSQGCAVVFSEGEGIDGMWNEPFTLPVDPRSPASIAKSLMVLLRNYPDGVPNEWIQREIRRFSWDNVASEYLGCFS